jgi:CRP-like cAMP-binding protein
MDEQVPFAPLLEGGISPKLRLTALRQAELLRAVEILRESTVEQLFELAGMAHEAEFARKATIFREEDAADTFYVIVEGEVEVASPEKGLREVVGSGRSFGLYSVLTRQPRRVTATALQPTVALAIKAEDFYNLLSDDTEIVANILRCVAQKCLKPCD